MARDADGAPLLMFGTHQDITKRKRQEMELQESERRFHAIIDASPLPILLDDTHGRIIYLNPAFTGTFGYDLDDIPLLDDWWTKAYPDPTYREEVKSQVFERIKRAEQGQSSLPAEARVRCKDGSFRTVSASIATLSGISKKVLMGIFYDLTLIRSISERLQHLLANASDGTHVLDMQGNIVEFSKSFANMLGYTTEETARLNLTDWEKSRPVQEVQSLIQNNMTAPTTFETKHRRKDGEFIDVEINAKGIILDGQPLLYASSRDITDRKNAENKLKQAILEQSAILENANVGITLVKDRIQLKCNRKMAEMFGYELEEMINTSTRILYDSQEEYESFGRQVYPVILGGGTYTAEREIAPQGWLTLVGAGFRHGR